MTGSKSLITSKNFWWGNHSQLNTEAMVHEFEACAECRQRCLLVHGNKKSGSHIDTSFFKIMFGKQFYKFMELPPKVARILLFSDRKTSLEDSSGQRWNIGISTVNGSSAFQQGWNAFALDHDLQVGDFLVFNYIVGSHFTVKIYDNSGCELNPFETIHQNNRKRDQTDGQCHAIVKSTMRTPCLDTFAGQDAEISKYLKEVSGMKKPLIITENASTQDDDNERSKCKRKTEFAHGMSCMMEREYGYQQGENRAHILDLSSFESFKKMRTCGSDGTNRVAAVNESHSYHADSILKLRTQVDSVNIPVAEEVANRVNPLDAAEVEMTEKNNKVKGASLSDKDSSTNVTSGHLLPTLPENPQPNDEIFSGISIRAAQKCQSANASGIDHQVAVSGQENDMIDDTCESANKKITDNAMKVIQDEPVELTSYPCSQEVIPESEAMMIIEKESVDLTTDLCTEEVIPQSNDDVMMIEKECVELTSHPCSQEVIPETNDEAMMIIEKESVYLTTDPYSEEVIPQRNDDVMIIEKETVDLTSDSCSGEIIEKKDKATAIIENVTVDLTSDQSNEEVIEKGMSLDFLTRVNNQSSNSQPRAIPSDPAEFERTEEYIMSEAKVNEVLADEDSCTETSGHPHSKNPKAIAETIPDCSKTNSDILKKATKECQNADASALLLGHDQVALSEKEPDLIDDSFPRDNKKLTGTAESIHNPITSERQNHNDVIISEKESVEVTCQEVIPQRNDIINIENETVEVTLESCSQEVISKKTISTEEESAEVTLDPIYQEVIPKKKGQSLKFFDRLHEKRDDTNIRAAPSDASDLKSPKKSNNSEIKVRKVSASDKVQHTNQTTSHLKPLRPVHVEEDKTNSVKIYNREINRLKTANRSGNVQVAVSQKQPVLIDDCCQQAKKKSAGDSESFKAPVTFGSQDYSAQPLKTSNKFETRSKFARESVNTLPVVKTEPVEDVVATFPSFTISCLATDRRSFLELPKSLPLPLNHLNRRSKLDRRIVYLQGGDNRLWPVLYIQKFFFRTLACGWEAFSTANNIERGDHCTIAVTNQSEGICTVQIVKMRDDMELFLECEQQPIIN